MMGNSTMVLIENGWDKITVWECLFMHRQQGPFSIQTRGRHQNGEKENQSKTHVGKIDETNRSMKEPTHLAKSSTLGVHATWMWTKPQDYRRVQELIQVFDLSSYDQTGTWPCVCGGDDDALVGMTCHDDSVDGASSLWSWATTFFHVPISTLEAIGIPILDRSCRWQWTELQWASWKSIAYGSLFS